MLLHTLFLDACYDVHPLWLREPLGNRLELHSQFLFFLENWILKKFISFLVIDLPCFSSWPSSPPCSKKSVFCTPSSAFFSFLWPLSWWPLLKWTKIWTYKCVGVCQSIIYFHSIWYFVWIFFCKEYSTFFVVFFVAFAFIILFE